MLSVPVQGMIKHSYQALLKFPTWVTSTSVSCHSTATMSQDKFTFYLIGDSNICKFLPIVKEAKTDIAIQNATLARATNSVQLRNVLSAPTELRSTVIISALTNLFTSTFIEDYDKLKVFAIRTFNEVLIWIAEGREAQEGFASTVKT
jgi:hypothetical protein